MAGVAITLNVVVFFLDDHVGALKSEPTGPALLACAGVFVAGTRTVRGGPRRPARAALGCASAGFSAGVLGLAGPVKAVLRCFRGFWPQSPAALVHLRTTPPPTSGCAPPWTS